ncbi:autophagy-related protein 22-like protein [Halteromyces radiatus]|uniref:autophagy-related protein 22-like protein n=1 Tax=Halteromyces radiatus TaxID=101107 RepID=UPI00221F501D|nr:autophagy-related protein 22-like protein [Halteromyces radiatus]KAI8084945.1 autophagy-related protein 22-like protein [Halteromyces radiatus]
MSSAEKLLKDPFKEDTPIDPTTEKGQEVLSQPPATRWELWSYYLYYNGNNGYNMYAFLPTLLQYMAQKGGFDPNSPPNARQPCNIALSNTSSCNVPWLNYTNGIPVVSMIMYVTAISFGIQFLLFTTFGSLADYGRYNHYILIIATLISCAAQILPIIFLNDDGSGWSGMMGLNIISMISYGTTLVFYAAAFPSLSDNLPVVRGVRGNPMISAEETQSVVEKWRNHVSAISTTFSNVGFLILSAVFSGISFIAWSNGPFLNDNQTFGNTPLYYFIASVTCGAFMLVNALPYFVLRPIGRRGPPLPPNENHLTIGWKSIFKALKEAKQYRYLFLYIISYFMFSDGVNAISSMQTYIQNDITSFSATETVVMGFITAITSIIGCLFFLFLAKQFNVSTKTNLLIIVIATGIVPIWGCFGIGLNNFGIKTQWELWVLSAWSGFFTGPIWAWQQTLLAELVPRGKENLFFGLFGIVNKASSWIGATAIGAVTEQTSNAYFGWPIIAALFVVATVILWFVDMEAAKLEMLHMEIQQEMNQNIINTRNSTSAPVDEKISMVKMDLMEDSHIDEESDHRV